MVSKLSIMMLYRDYKGGIYKMYIVTDNENNITQYVKIGGRPTRGNVFEIQVDDIPQHVLDNGICKYKFIDGDFTLRDDLGEQNLNIIKLAKINSMEMICQTAIIQGIDWNGKHYSLTYHDQLNINDMHNQALNGRTVYYHADGDVFESFSPQEFIEFATQVSNFKFFHNMYFNYLKKMINEETDINQIIQINYGSKLPPDLQEEFEDRTSDIGLTIQLIKDMTNYNEIINSSPKPI